MTTGLSSREFADSLAIRTFVSPLFHGAPIELEDVGDDHFLGLRVLIDKRQVHYIPVSHRWQVRHPKSAGSETHLVPGLTSRIVLFVGMFGLPLLREHQANNLKQFHVQAGYPPQIVWPL